MCASRTSVTSLQNSWDRCFGKVHFQASAVFVFRAGRFYMVPSPPSFFDCCASLPPASLSAGTLRTEKCKTKQPEIWPLFKQKHEQTQQPSGPMVWLLSWGGTSWGESARAHKGLTNHSSKHLSPGTKAMIQNKVIHLYYHISIHQLWQNIEVLCQAI